MSIYFFRFLLHFVDGQLTVNSQKPVTNNFSYAQIAKRLRCGWLKQLKEKGTAPIMINSQIVLR